MVGCKGGVRSLSLVVIVVVLLHGRAAEAGNPCYAECFQGCSAKCFISPPCMASCAYTCALSDTCSHIGFLPQNEERKQAEAVHYCKLGCASSVCSVISTTLRLDSSRGHVSEEAVKGSVKLCDNACSEMCIKRFSAAVVAA